MERNIKRGEIYDVDLSPVIGSEQGGKRPCLIVQNDMGNKHSPTTIIATITTSHTKKKLPTHVEISKEESGLHSNSIILLEQIRTIDEKRIRDKSGQLSKEKMEEVNRSLGISFGINFNLKK